jgi:hypothetical protein
MRTYFETTVKMESGRMNMPNFQAEASLLPIGRSYRGIPAGDDGERASAVVPQALEPCIDACQQSWYDCLSQCQWFEWVIGSCMPKCRGGWLGCLQQNCRLT